MRAALDLRDERLLHDLIGRPERPAPTPSERIAYAGERVLVTGAGGSVGSELVRQIAELGPRHLVLVDHSEYALFRIEQEMRERWPGVSIEPVLADVTRRSAMAQIFGRRAPDAVFHAAAYKHVAMMERDVLSAARANVFGTLHVSRLARESGARFLLISSDKAANARSVMGATKRLAELAVLASPRPSRHVIVRFGNVAGSSGSVVELMVDRIRRGQPLLVTDPEATRYFMSASEAVSLVLRADRLRRTGDIFWLDMGEPVRIIDLAHRLLRIARSAGLPEVPIQTIGLRPGEKLQEELTVQGLELITTGQPGVLVARQPAFDRGRIQRVVSLMRGALKRHDALGVLSLLCVGVPEYEPSMAAREAAAHLGPGRESRSPLAALHA